MTFHANMSCLVDPGSSVVVSTLLMVDNTHPTCISGDNEAYNKEQAPENESRGCHNNNIMCALKRLFNDSVLSGNDDKNKSSNPNQVHQNGSIEHLHWRKKVLFTNFPLKTYERWYDL